MNESWRDLIQRGQDLKDEWGSAWERVRCMCKHRGAQGRGNSKLKSPRAGKNNMTENCE